MAFAILFCSGGVNDWNAPAVGGMDYVRCNTVVVKRVVKRRNTVVVRRVVKRGMPLRMVEWTMSVVMQYGL